MFMQIFQDIVVIGGMFFLRIGLPLLIVLGAGYLIRRWLEPKAIQEQFEGIVRTAQEEVAQPVQASVQHSK
jgi:acetylglutamate kinase